MSMTVDQLGERVGPLILNAIATRGLRLIGHHWLMLDDTGRPITVNKAKAMHRMAWATAIAEQRLMWWHYATHARVPRLNAAHIYVTPLHGDLRSPQDVAACAPAAKAAVDGLVDAGVLPDDDPHHLRAVTFLPPLICGVNGMALVVEDIG